MGFLRKIGWAGIIITLIPVAMIGRYVSEKIRYRGLPDWPSVLATNIDVGGETHRKRSDSAETGTGWTTLDLTYLEFDYVVDGKSYHGTRGSADDRFVPFAHAINDNGEITAYYNPKDPSIAVISPYPYQGSDLQVFFAFAAVLCGAYWVLQFRNPPK